MIAMLFRVGLLTVGFAAVELGLPPALAAGSIGAWALTGLGLIFLIAGSAGFIGPLLGGAARKGDSPDA
ncbi:MAG: hypothetical protein HYX54_08040 [Chloroflexi bacterium]|nr:hypothetical protein [Chloroflexota bacterium]